MFFQYGKMQCTPTRWATKLMQWKIILPLELVKPLLWAASSEKCRSGMSAQSRNKSTQFWLPIPVEDSTLEERWPAEQARRSEHSKRQRRNPGHTQPQRGAQADRLLIEPHVWCKDSERSEHDVRFATNMTLLRQASEGYVEQDKEKMPEWWYTHLLDELLAEKKQPAQIVVRASSAL